MARITLIEKDRAAIVLRNLYETTERQLGMVPKLLKAMAHRPELAVTFANFLRELWTGGGVPPRLKLIAALRAAFLGGADYCISHLVALGPRVGLGAAQVDALREGSYETSGGFDEREKAVARLADKLTAKPNSIADDDLKKLRKWFGEADLVELNLLVGAVNLTDAFALCFSLEPEAAFSSH